MVKARHSQGGGLNQCQEIFLLTRIPMLLKPDTLATASSNGTKLLGLSTDA